MMNFYKPKEMKLKAEQLETDVELKNKSGKIFYLQGGNYLIFTPDGKIYPANKELFEFLFEKEEENNEDHQPQQ